MDDKESLHPITKERMLAFVVMMAAAIFSWATPYPWWQDCGIIILANITAQLTVKASNESS